MKILTTNFLTCAVKSCKTSPKSYPLHFRDATLERAEIDFNPLFVRNILPRVDWNALKITASELGLGSLVPDQNPGDVEERSDTTGNDETMAEVDAATEKEIPEEVLKKLHELLLETMVIEGKLVCENCGFEYPIKEGVGNFLLPSHLV